MIKNIVFDLGNVLVSFQPKVFFLRMFKEQTKTDDICTKIFTHEAWSLYDQGVYQLIDLYRVYGEEYPDDIEDIKQVLLNWLKLLEVIPTTYTLLKQLKKEGYNIYILSNISKDSADYLKSTQDFFLYVDGTVFSYEEKLNKPDPKIYDILVNRYQLKVSETIFIDDQIGNIHQAQKLGIHGIVFLNIKQVEQEVRDIIRRMREC